MLADDRWTQPRIEDRAAFLPIGSGATRQAWAGFRSKRGKRACRTRVVLASTVGAACSFALKFGQPSYNDNENPESWILYRPALEADMALAPGFHERMASTWATWRATELSDATIDATLAANPALLGDAVDRNFERWPIGDIQFGGYLYAVSSYDEELARVSAFVHARLAWMDDNVASW